MQPHSKEVKKWRANNPLKVKAHIAVNNAIRAGKLIKQPCRDCGITKVEAHHSDYSKPLDVVWLCKKCHVQEHWREREEKRKIEKRDNKVSQSKRTVVAGRSRKIGGLYDIHYSTVHILRKEGRSYAEIAKILSLTKGKVYKIFNNTSYN